MTGWSGATANRTWQRDRRTAGTSLTDDVQQILAAWRAEHGWQPGATWDPYTAAYITPHRTTA